MAMAIQTESGSPEWHSVMECTSILIDSIKEDPDRVAAALFEKQLLSQNEYDKEVFVTGTESTPHSKSQRIVAAVTNKIKCDSQFFEELLHVLEGRPGILIKQCAEKLLHCFKQKQSMPHGSQEKAGFVCPYCKLCSLKTYFTSGCPQAMSCDSCVKPFSLSFPYLDTKHLSRKDEYLLYKKLKEDFDMIATAFVNLCQKLSESKTLAIMLNKVKTFLSFLPKFIGTLKEWIIVASCESVEQLLGILCRKHASFYNYELIHLIVNEYGSEDDRTEFEKYLESFRLYCTNSVFEVPYSVLRLPQPDMNDPQFALKYSVEGCIDLNQVKSICLLIADILCINPWDFHLRSIEQGCILLRLVISEGVAWKLLPITLHQQEALGKLKLAIMDQRPKGITIYVYPIDRNIL